MGKKRCLPPPFLWDSYIMVYVILPTHTDFLSLKYGYFHILKDLFSTWKYQIYWKKMVLLTSSASLNVICCRRFSNALRWDKDCIAVSFVLGNVDGVLWRVCSPGLESNDLWSRSRSLSLSRSLSFSFSFSGLPFLIRFPVSNVDVGLQSEKSCSHKHHGWTILGK